MFEILDQIQNSTNIKEWINPLDPRLEHATGQPAPQKGGVDRWAWEIYKKDWPVLAAAVKRLIVPEDISNKAFARVTGDEDWNRVILTVPTAEDWSHCFPADDLTNILTVHGLKRWAAVAITDTNMGMAVFSSELKRGTIVARVQSIPQETVAGIVN